MAVSGTDANRVNRVLTTTLDRYSPQISNEIARNDGVVAVFGNRGAIKVVSGGERAIETLDTSENPNFAFRSKYSDVPTSRADTRAQAKFAFATIDGAVAINDIEKAMNMGEARIYDLVAAEIDNAKRTIVRKVADALRASTPGTSEPESVLSIIQDAAGASQTGSTGEISRTSNTYWRNAYSATAMDLSSVGGVEALFAFILQTVAKGTSKLDRPDFGLTSGTIYAALASFAENVRRFQPDSKTADLGLKYQAPSSLSYTKTWVEANQSNSGKPRTGNPEPSREQELLGVCRDLTAGPKGKRKSNPNRNIGYGC